MYLSPLELKNHVQAITHILSEIIDNILMGHISGQVGVSHARKTTHALFFFFYTPLNKCLSQIFVHPMTSKRFEIF